MLRTYKLKHSINQGKQTKILALLDEYRKVSDEISKKQWIYFYKNGKFNRDLEVNSIKSELSQRYRQIAQYQVVSQLDSYIGNRQNDFKSYITNSHFDKDTKIKLYYINRYKKWFYESVKMKDKEIEQNILKLSRTIIKNIFKKNRKPNLKFCNMALDAKVVEITPNGVKKVKKSEKLKDENEDFILNKSGNPKLRTYIQEEERKKSSYDYWIKLSTLEKGKKIYLPLTTNKYFEGLNGDIKNFVQINFKQDISKINGNIALFSSNKIEYKMDICLIKDIEKEEYQPKIDKLALDLGLNNLFATNLGELYGRNFSKLLKKYDEIIFLLAKNRQKQRLKTLSKKYKKLINKIKAYLKNEINRVINKLIANNRPKEIIVERLNFTSPKLSKKLNGIIISQINPAYTSQECSKCGYIAKNNRKNQETFICGFCGKKQNADINASKNILARSSSYLKDVFAKRAFILDKTVKNFIERHSVVLLYLFKTRDIGKSSNETLSKIKHKNNLCYNSLANTLTSNPYLTNYLNGNFLEIFKVSR